MSAPSSTSTAPARLDRTRDLRGRARHPWVRRIVLLVMAVVVALALALALAGTFGQEEHVVHAAGDAGTVDLRAPTALRGGLLWRSRIPVRARTLIERPQLVLGAGYVSGMQVNTIEPGASRSWTSSFAPSSSSP